MRVSTPKLSTPAIRAWRSWQLADRSIDRSRGAFAFGSAGGASTLDGLVGAKVESAAGVAVLGDAAEAASGAGHPVVTSAQSKLATLAEKFGTDPESFLDNVLGGGIRYIDTANDGNINIFLERVDSSGYIQVALDPTGRRVISAGLNTSRDVVNGISSGPFAEVP